MRQIKSKISKILSEKSFYSQRYCMLTVFKLITFASLIYNIQYAIDHMINISPKNTY